MPERHLVLGMIPSKPFLLEHPLPSVLESALIEVGEKPFGLMTECPNPSYIDSASHSLSLLI
jgi:hypothetical protein